MIKVRVSEETPNLSHPSNLISAVRLENSSPSLMRLIKASGCTHSWKKKKVDAAAILLREQETLSEMPRARELKHSC
jgi:hypothetical protein